MYPNLEAEMTRYGYTAQNIADDERAQEVLIRARYDDWFTMTKRAYKTCLCRWWTADP